MRFLPFFSSLFSPWPWPFSRISRGTKKKKHFFVLSFAGTARGGNSSPRWRLAPLHGADCFAEPRGDGRGGMRRAGRRRGGGVLRQKTRKRLRTRGGAEGLEVKSAPRGRSRSSSVDTGIPYLWGGAVPLPQIRIPSAGRRRAPAGLVRERDGGRPGLRPRGC